MIDPTRIPFGQVARVAKDGSPLLLQALGRLYGIGPAERQALGADGAGVPAWAIAALALGVGLVVGARVQRQYPQYVPSIVSGDAA